MVGYILHCLVPIMPLLRRSRWNEERLELMQELMVSKRWILAPFQGLKRENPWETIKNHLLLVLDATCMCRLRDFNIAIQETSVNTIWILVMVVDHVVIVSEQIHALAPWDLDALQVDNLQQTTNQRLGTRFAPSCIAYAHDRSLLKRSKHCRRPSCFSCEKERSSRTHTWMASNYVAIRPEMGG